MPLPIPLLPPVTMATFPSRDMGCSFVCAGQRGGDSPAAAIPAGRARCSPTRMALAMAVRAGFTAPMLGKKLVSTTYRLSSSWALQLGSSTDVAGSVPNRQVPA